MTSAVNKRESCFASLASSPEGSTDVNHEPKTFSHGKILSVVLEIGHRSAGKRCSVVRT